MADENLDEELDVLLHEIGKKHRAALARGWDIDIREELQSCDPRISDALAESLVHIHLRHESLDGFNRIHNRKLADFLPLLQNFRPAAVQRLFADAERQARQSFENATRPSAIGNYRIVDVIGRGGMGVVYRGETFSGESLAIKVVASHLQDNEEAQRRFETEKTVLAGISHEGVVGYKDAVECNGLSYLVMDFVDGESLAELLKRDKVIAPIEAATIIASAADAAHAAHHAHIIHRDIKPGNILLKSNRDPIAVLVDFGLVHEMTEGSDVERAGSVGTLEYMAPEQLGDQWGEIGPATDVFALAATLYRCVVGFAPFGRGTPQQSIADTLSESAPIHPRAKNKTIPIGLEDIILKGLEKRQSRRYQSAADLRDDLNRFLANRRPNASQFRRAKRFIKACRQNPVRATVWTSSIVIALVVVGFSSWNSFAAQKRNFQRAAEEVVRLKLAAFETTVRETRSAAERGDFDVAKQRFTEAIEFGGHQTVALIHERLDCYLPLGQRDALEVELKRIEAAGAPPEFTAKRKLLGADCLFQELDLNLGIRASALIAEVLEAPEGLLPHELAYAKGLASKSLVEARRHFLYALENCRRPFYHRANAALAVNLALSGRFAEARERTSFMRKAFAAADFTASRLDLLIAILSNSSHEEIETHYAEIAVGEGKLVAEHWRRIGEPLRKAITDLRPDGMEIVVPEFFQLALLAQNRSKGSSLNLSIAGAMQLVPELGEMLLLFCLVPRGHQSTAERAERAFATHGDAFFLYIAGTTQMFRGVEFGKKVGNTAVERDAGLAALRNFRLAGDPQKAPSVIPWVHEEARRFAALADYALLLDQRIEPARLDQLAVPLYNLLSDVKVIPFWRNLIAETILKNGPPGHRQIVELIVKQFPIHIEKKKPNRAIGTDRKNL